MSDVPNDVLTVRLAALADASDDSDWADVRRRAGVSGRGRRTASALRAVAVVLALVILSTAVVARVTADEPPRTAYTPLEFPGLRAYPMDTLDDVRTHADAIVLATVLSEAPHESREAFYGEEGLVGRRITIRIDRSLWQKENAPSPPRTFDTAGGSWFYRQGVREPLFKFGEVGEQYVFVLAKNTSDTNNNSYEWVHEGTLGAPLIGGRTPTDIESEKPYFQAIRGKTPDELERLFDTTLGR